MAEAMIGRGPGGIMMSRAELGRLIALLVPLALVGGAIGSQYFASLHPCEMCYWQRYAHFAAIPLAALAFTAPAPAPRARAFTLLAAVAIAVSGAIGIYHAGVEIGIFEGFTTCTSTAKGLSTEELLKQLMKVPLVRCDQVQWAFLGISMAGWNAIVSLPAAAAIAWLTLSGRNRG